MHAFQAGSASRPLARSSHSCGRILSAVFVLVALRCVGLLGEFSRTDRLDYVGLILFRDPLASGLSLQPRSYQHFSCKLRSLRSVRAS